MRYDNASNRYEEEHKGNTTKAMVALEQALVLEGDLDTASDLAYLYTNTANSTASPLFLSLAFPNFFTHAPRLVCEYLVNVLVNIS